MCLPLPHPNILNYISEFFSILKNYSVDFEPDRAALLSDELPAEVRLADLIDINAPDKWGSGSDTKPPNNGGGGGGMAPMQPGKFHFILNWAYFQIRNGCL